MLYACAAAITAVAAAVALLMHYPECSSIGTTDGLCFRCCCCFCCCFACVLLLLLLLLLLLCMLLLMLLPPLLLRLLHATNETDASW